MSGDRRASAADRLDRLPVLRVEEAPRGPAARLLRPLRSRPTGLALLLLFVAAITTGCVAGASGEDPVAPPTTLEDRSFTDLRSLEVPVAGRTVPLGESDLTYHRGTVDRLDDPETPGHDGISASIRDFLACERDTWSIGAQTFTVDPLSVGLAEGDPSLVDRGLAGVDWGVTLDLGDDGVHRLTRGCDGKTVADFGGTHHTAQWLEALGQTVHLLRSSDEADAREEQVAAYVARMEEIAVLLVRDDNWAHWVDTWLVDDEGEIFTHKTYMMAAGLSLAASVSDDRGAAAEWATRAQEVASRGLDAQWEDGTNPERGGYDVSYQMYGTWLAQLYYATLEPGEMKDAVGGMIDRSIQWMRGRVDDRTGVVDIGESTRTCSDIDGNSPYEAADAVRVMLTWAAVHPERTDLLEEAVLIDTGAKSPGNPCS